MLHSKIAKLHLKLKIKFHFYRKCFKIAHFNNQFNPNFRKLNKNFPLKKVKLILYFNFINNLNNFQYFIPYLIIVLENYYLFKSISLIESYIKIFLQFYDLM